ncbi:MAG: arginine--tRNA ligase [Parcubacteria group bacterium]|nr:arginine--tRNA ligase [Parcubacteria group bacterium]
MKKQIFDFLKEQYPGIGFDVFYPPEGLGDYSTNIAFLLSKSQNTEISAATGEVIEKLKNQFAAEFEKIEVAKNGFINFYLSKEYLQSNLSEALKLPNIGEKKTVIIEYSQPNIAKFMHVGHLRSTILGNALANIYESLGYKVIRWNYLGDWGTQFGKLIAAYKLWGSVDEVKKNSIEVLNALYVRFHEELKSRPELEERGREEFKKLEEGDGGNRELWKWFKDESLKEFDKIYGFLGIKFDTNIGESFFANDTKPLIKGLKDKGIAEESEGAVIINLDKFNLPPALIQRSDGASLYLTRDIAALRYRIKEYKPEKILYVVGNEQSLHFEQLKAIAEILWGQDEILEYRNILGHVKFGLILGEDKKKLSSREGRVIAMEDLIDKAIKLAGKTVEEKNPELSENEKEEVSEAVGIGALKYFILKEHRNSDIVFDWGRILDFKGDTGPYLQYTYARLAGIKKKAPKRYLAISKFFRKSDFRFLREEIEFSLMKKLIKFPEAVASAAENNLLNILALYLYELSNLANRFYESSPVLQEEDEKLKTARLALVDLTGRVLERGLGLLGIEALERI